MRFLHIADIHLSKPFGRFEEDTRAALRAARLQALKRAGQEASARKADFILVAGDTFDAEAPPSKTVRRALGVMADFPQIQWVLMPGNHDSLAAVDLWERIEKEKPDNVILALKPEVIAISDTVAVLPAPPAVRNPGLDLTDWMSDARTGSRFRIGLAHGGVLDFGSEEGSAAVIPPDRAERSNLDYLALGDWHGRLSITPRTWYAGSPEADGFKPHDPAGALLVEIEKPGDMPVVTPVPLGRFAWKTLKLDFFAGENPVETVRDALAPVDREHTLVRIEATGRLGLLESSLLREECDRIADDFHHFEVLLDDLGIEQVVDDLNMIAPSGALRDVANKLFEATDIQGRTAQDVKIAKTALTHLFHIAQEELEP